MKKLLVLFFLMVSGVVWSQQYDVYLSYFYRAFDFPINNQLWDRTGSGNVFVTDDNGNPVISFSETFETFNRGQFDAAGTIAGTTSSSTLNFSASLRVDTSPQSFFGTDSGSLNGVGNSGYQINLTPGWYFSGLVTKRPRITVTVPNNPECYSQDITLVATAGHRIEYEWEYLNLQGQWTSFGDTLSSQTFNLTDIYPDSADLVAVLNTNNPIQFRVYNPLNDYYANASYRWIGCSPDLTNTEETNTSCFESTDGGVTLTFDENVDTANGFQMRYYVYQGDPAQFPMNRLEDETQPVFTGVQVINDPLITLNGSLEGDYSGLGQGNYFIVYQEVKFDGLDVIVKSAGITGQLTIGSPSRVEISNVTVTQPTCSLSATGSATISVSGGQEFEPTSTYLFSSDDGMNWQPSPTFNNLVQGNSYTFRTKLMLSGNQECLSTDRETRSIPILTNLLSVNSGTGISGQPSSPSSNNGSLFIRVDNGVQNYTYDLYLSSNPGNSIQTISKADRFHEFTGLDEGTYFVIVTDGNSCNITTSEYTLVAPALPTLGSPTVMELTCANDTNGQIAIDVSGGTAPYSYQWFRNGILLSNDTTSTNLVFDNLDDGNYELVLASSGVDINTNPSSVVRSGVISLNDPTPVTIDTVVPTDISCFGADDGSITIEASGGGTYDYSLESIPGLNGWTPLIDNTIGNLSGGFYYLTIRNENGCESATIVNLDIFIDEPEELEVTEDLVQHQDVTINGGDNGAITIDVTGGNPNSAPNEYSFLWTGTIDADGSSYSNNTQNIQNLRAGNYTVLVRDTKNCETTLGPIQITEPGPLSIQSLTKTDTCNGLDSGTLTTTVQGIGDIIFEFLQNPGPSETVVYLETSENRTVIVPNLGAGTYGLRITEVTSSEVRTTDPVDYVTITELDEITADVAKTDVSCNGFNGGTITVSGVSGGSPFAVGPNALTGYEYRINDTFNTFQPEAVFENVVAGSYTLTVRDALGCEFNTAVEVIQTGVPVLDVLATTVTNASSNTNSDGSIVLEFEGDDTNYTYNWIGTGITINNVKNQIGVPAGNYQVTITAPGNCTLVVPFTVGVQATVSVTITGQQNPCFGETNGSITAAVTGTGPYNLQWFEASVPILGETGLTLENVGAGTYTLNVVDLGETPNTVGNSPGVILVEPQEITATIDTTPSCAANGTGAITVTAVQGGEPGGVQDYTYSIDGTNFQNNPLFETLTAQTYSVWVRDGNGCDGIFSGITVAPSPPIEWDETNVIVTNATAQGVNDGAIILAFNSDATNYTYEWNGPGTVNETTQNLTGKGAGVYTVIVRNENGCTLERIFTISEPGLLTVTVNTIKNPCFGENNGNIQTTIVGTGNLSYQWSETVLGDLAGQVAPDLNNAPAGIYTLTVTDNAVIPANVVSSNPITLTGPPTILALQTAPTDAQCAGVADGTVTLTASGGIPPYEYSIDGGATYQTSATFASLGLGTYSFRVRDNNDCVADSSVTINEPPTITFDFVATPLTAAGATNGAIDIAASGGTGDLSFSWTGPAGFTPTTDEDITGLTAGDYTVTVTDENGCTFVSNPITIDEPGALSITLTLNEGIPCNGDEFGEILADVQGGVPDYTYQWFLEGNNTPLGETTNMISNLRAGNYFLRVTDANGIQQDSNILLITEPPVLQVTLQNKVDIICSGEATGAITIAIQGGTAPYAFQWNNGADSQNLTNIEAGDYFVEVFDNNGCFELLEVTVNPAPNALQLEATVADVSEYLANDGSISLNITGGTTPYSINWISDSDGSFVGNTATIAALAADSYTVSVSDANGCNITEPFEVTQPDIVEETIVQPSCQGDMNGSISVLVNKGNGDFSYLWNTGETTNTITNLGAGDYSVTITGFGDGPLTRTYTLEEPLPLLVNLGEDRVLCSDQVLELDATVDDETATYIWTSDNGFSSSNPQVTLTTTGNYTVTVQTASGCTAIGNLNLEVSSDDIDAEFAMSSQVFTGNVLVIVDISFPLPEVIEWTVPEGAAVVKQDSDELELIFSQAGEYEITVTTKRGDCIAQKTKTVLVVTKDGSIGEDDSNTPNKLVEDFVVYPNPTSGEFTVDVTLTESGNISLKVFNFANNAMVASEKGRGEISYSVPFDISGMPSGVYAILLETPFGTSLQKVVVR